MSDLQITQLRLHNQMISHPQFDQPAEAVRWLGAIQSQDYLAAKWALGQRVLGSTDAAIEQACDEGTILRTHILRPTWHFVTSNDIHWMRALTAPRVHAAMAFQYRRLELDDALFLRTDAVLAKALQGGKHLTRAEIEAGLQQAGLAGFPEESLRIIHIIAHAELEGIACSGARRGKQPTYALLDERAPQTRTLAREEALAELARRYFTSRGPATLKDFIWWSGLSSGDAKAGLEMNRPRLIEERVAGQSYWLDPESLSAAAEISPAVHLLPNFDEYVVGYANRSAIYDPIYNGRLDARGNFILNHTIVIDGKVVGTWKRTLKKKEVVFTPDLFNALSTTEEEALSTAIARYGQFLQLVVERG